MPIAIRCLLAILCLSLLTGGARMVTHLPEPKVAPPATPAYTFVDKRPKKWRKTGMETSSPRSCAYGAYRIGEDDMTPNPAVLLHAMLAERFGDRLAGKTVQLRGIGLHVNNGEQLRAQMNGMFPLLTPEAKAHCPPDAFGGYSPGEIGEGLEPMIAAVDVMIDGQRFIGRALSEHPRFMDKPAPGAPNNWDATAGRLFLEALAQLGDRIEAGLFAPAPAATAAPETPAAGASP